MKQCPDFFQHWMQSRSKEQLQNELRLTDINIEEYQSKLEDMEENLEEAVAEKEWILNHLKERDTGHSPSNT
jgi:hypothetical protein